MFMNDASKKDVIRNVAVQDLRELGIKYRPKKQKQQTQDTRLGRRLFKTALHLLPMQTVTLTSGQQLIVPKLVHELCSFILSKIETEGLFRKGGSKSRQNEIKLSLDAGCSLGDSHHEIDIANILKTFFRELPEPLFPYTYHDSFLHCTILQKSKIEAILLTCLLLPSEHLNTLAYFMQFLHHVTEYSNLNKMDAYNLAVIIGPTVFPSEEKLGVNTTHRLTKICELFQILIENSCNIGVIPDQIIDKIIPLTGSSTNSVCEEDCLTNKSKKKRRSGSLTRMFSGLRKIVGGKSSDDAIEVEAKPDLLGTPSLSKSSKKRKLESTGFSNKKRRELIKALPDGVLLNTPVSIYPKGKDKKSQWNLGYRRQKQDKHGENTTSASSLANTKSILVKRWSAVSLAAGFKRNKSRNSCGTSSPKSKSPVFLTSKEQLEKDLNISSTEKPIVEPDYVKISRAEYEQIKNRVLAIENRLSLEFTNLEKENEEINISEENSNLIVKVQNAYEETLVTAKPLSPTTDQLARRLSKELKIRHSTEQKIIRSPSARKIGSLRRRSKERITKVQRNKSWHVERSNIIRRSSKNSQLNSNIENLSSIPCKNEEEMKSVVVKLSSSPVVKTTRASSFHGKETPSFIRSCQRNPSLSYNNSANNSIDSSKIWISAEGFFSNMKTPRSFEELANCRASLARLRSQNAGAVLAKARLFDCMNDSVNLNNSSQTATSTNFKTGGRKIGQVRNLSKSAFRNRNLKSNDKNVTPRKKSRSVKSTEQPLPSLNNEKENEFQIELNSYFPEGNKLSLSNRNNCNIVDKSEAHKINHVSPYYYEPSKCIPHIKKSLTTKTPKRLCRTPLSDENRQTPLRILTSKYIY